MLQVLLEPVLKLSEDKYRKNIFKQRGEAI